jgi:hypothetical protein
VRQTVEFLTLLAVLINICAAAYIIYRDPHRLENRLFALIASMLAVTCFGEYLMASGADAGTVLTGDRIAVSFWILMAAVFIHFAMVVSGWTREKRRGYLVGLYTFCGILTLINVFSRLFVKGIDFAPAALNLNHEIGGPLWLPLLMLLGFRAQVLRVAGGAPEHRNNMPGGRDAGRGRGHRVLAPAAV